MKSWLKKDGEGSLLRLYIQPGASKDEVSGEFADRLKIKVKAAPRDGEANEAVLHFLAKKLGISKSKISLIRGEASRQKDFYVDAPYESIITCLI